MGPFAAGQVVLVAFPYSDLSRSKQRPVLLLARGAHRDWLAAQITSNPIGDQYAIALNQQAFQIGGLGHLSFVRPGKLFTAAESILSAPVGQLRRDVFVQVREALISLLRTT